MTLQRESWSVCSMPSCSQTSIIWALLQDCFIGLPFPQLAGAYIFSWLPQVYIMETFIPLGVTLIAFLIFVNQARFRCFFRCWAHGHEASCKQLSVVNRTVWIPQMKEAIQRLIRRICDNETLHMLLYTILTGLPFVPTQFRALVTTGYRCFAYASGPK